MSGVASPAVWAATVVVLLGVIVGDLLLLGRRRRQVSLRDATLWVGVYVGIAAVFALGLVVLAGDEVGKQFVAGYLTEYSLSMDNLFVFLVIMTRFAVPRVARDRVLFIGIAVSLVLRAACIVAGAAAIAAFNWVFYLFGALLLYTAAKLAFSGEGGDEAFGEYAVLRALRRILPASPQYREERLTTVVDGRRLLTPLVFVILAIGLANVVFALDSIPAIFGLTQDPYLVFTTNALALMGLRQLFFLIAGLLSRIVYLNVGLAAILAFIGVKLLLEALHGSQVDRIGDVRLPVIGTTGSLEFIAATLTITVAASLLRGRIAGLVGRRRARGMDVSGEPELD